MFNVWDKVEVSPDSQYFWSWAQIESWVIDSITTSGSYNVTWIKFDWLMGSNIYYDHDLILVRSSNPSLPFSIGDKVELKGGSKYKWIHNQIQAWTVCDTDYNDMEVQVENETGASSRYEPDHLQLQPVTGTTPERGKIGITDCAVWIEINVWWFPCKYACDKWELGILYRDYLYSSSYYGEPEDFIKANKPTIKGFFIHKTDGEVNRIMKVLEDAQAMALYNIDWLILDDTRDLILSRVFETTTKYVSDISDKLTDKSLKAKFKKALGI